MLTPLPSVQTLQGGVPVDRTAGRAVLLQHQSTDGAGPAAGRHVPGATVRRRVPGQHGRAARYPTLRVRQRLLLLRPLRLRGGASRGGERRQTYEQGGGGYGLHGKDTGKQNDGLCEYSLAW